MSTHTLLRSLSLRVLLVCGGTVGLLQDSLLAQAISTEAQLIVPTDGETFDSYGRAVAISGNVAVVGAFGDDDVGSATVLRRIGGAWVEEQELTAPVPTPGDLFGFTVDVEGGLLVIGASGDDDLGNDSGSVYVYEFDGSSSTWVPRPTLRADDGQAGDHFGESVALAAGVLAIGAPGANAQGRNSGAVYVFRWNGGAFVQEQKLGATGPDAGSQQGWSVATDGAVVASGAITDSLLATDAGAVHIYRYDGSTWQAEQVLRPSDGAAGDWMGWGVDVQGDLLVAGAIHHDDGESDTGAAYAFRWNGADWMLEQKLMHDSLSGYDLLGWDISISGPRVLVGSPGAFAINGAGVALLFQDTGSQWVESHAWVQSNPNDGGPFLDSTGVGVALDGSRALVGSPFATNPVTGAKDAGAAYAYDVTPLAQAMAPGAVSPGEPFEVRTYGGSPGGQMGLVITEITGTPVFKLFYLGGFDGLGRNILPVVTPAGFSGNVLTVVGVGYFQPGVLGVSNLAKLTLD